MRIRHVASGKIREVFAVGEDLLLLVASDRVSAFDVVMAEEVPDKGRVLTAMTAWWLDVLRDVAPSHLVALEPPAGAEPSDRSDLPGRCMLVRRARMLPVEWVVRGYLTGSAWVEYERNGTVHGRRLPPGLRHADRLPEVLLTPARKQLVGHDDNITLGQAAALVGDDLVAEAERICLQVYERATAAAAARGVIVADTKLELGMLDGRLAICDEVLTPDSSRLWPAERWVPGSVPPCYDKQPLRDWLAASGWDRTGPPPSLPPEVISGLRHRYVTAYEQVTGRSLSAWPGGHGA